MSERELSDESSTSQRLLGPIETPSGVLTEEGTFHNSTSTTEANAHGLTLWNGLALVLSIQIGAGVFTAPWQVSNHVVSPAVGLTVWLFAGLLVWTGAASFIELGTAIPKNGGVQEYLRHCYGDLYGCMFTWSWIFIRKPAAMAIISTVFADYLYQSVLGTWKAPQVVLKIISIGALSLVTAINCLGAKSGALVAGGFLVLKLAAVLIVTFIGLWAVLARHEGLKPPGQGASWSKTYPFSEQHGYWAIIGNYTSAVYGSLLCYGGWEAVRILNALAKILLVDHYTLDRVCRRRPSESET